MFYKHTRFYNVSIAQCQRSHEECLPKKKLCQPPAVYTIQRTRKCEQFNAKRASNTINDCTQSKTTNGVVVCSRPWVSYEKPAHSGEGLLKGMKRPRGWRELTSSVASCCRVCSRVCFSERRLSNCAVNWEQSRVFFRPSPMCFSTFCLRD